MADISPPWHETSRELPPENVLVETISAGGMPSQLRRSGNLWFLRDWSMYVYYEVKWWRVLAN
jgi:hypothetical protein